MPEKRSVFGVAVVCGVVGTTLIEMILYFAVYPEPQPASDWFVLACVFILISGLILGYFGLEEFATLVEDGRERRARLKFERLQYQQRAKQLEDEMKENAAEGSAESLKKLQWRKYLETNSKNGKLYMRIETEMTVREAAWRWSMIQVLKWMEKAGTGKSEALVGERGCAFEKLHHWTRVMDVMKANSLVDKVNGIETVLAAEWNGDYGAAVAELEADMPIKFDAKDPPLVMEFKSF